MVMMKTTMMMMMVILVCVSFRFIAFAHGCTHASKNSKKAERFLIFSYTSTHIWHFSSYSLQYIWIHAITDSQPMLLSCTHSTENVHTTIPAIKAAITKAKENMFTSISSVYFSAFSKHMPWIRNLVPIIERYTFLARAFIFGIKLVSETLSTNYIRNVAITISSILIILIRFNPSQTNTQIKFQNWTLILRKRQHFKLLFSNDNISHVKWCF